MNIQALEAQNPVSDIPERISVLSGLVPAGERLLDIGCHNGLLGQMLSDRFREVHGVDINPTAVAEARSRGVQAISQSADDPLPYPSSYFDVVTLIGTLPVVPTPGRALAEIRRVLSDDGRLYLNFANGRSVGRLWSIWLKGHARRHWYAVDGSTGWLAQHVFTPADIREMLSAHRFRITGEYGMLRHGPYIPGRLAAEMLSGELMFTASKAPISY